MQGETLKFEKSKHKLCQ